MITRIYFFRTYYGFQYQYFIKVRLTKNCFIYIPFQINNFEIWQRPLHKPNTYAIAIINSDNEGAPRMVKLTLSNFGVMGAPAFNVTDVFDAMNHGTAYVNDTFYYEVEPTGIYMLRLDPVYSWKKPQVIFN